jgi:hypothetical protein
MPSITITAAPEAPAHGVCTTNVSGAGAPGLDPNNWACGGQGQGFLGPMSFPPSFFVLSRFWVFIGEGSSKPKKKSCGFVLGKKINNKNTT